jgi:hypothetical protein
MYKIQEIDIPLPNLSANSSKISETKSVQPGIERYLKGLGYDVHKEARAFHILHLHYALNQRVDFLAFSGQDAHIIECKGSDLRLAQVFPAILQITLYMRLYKMLQVIPNPQLVLDHELDPSLVRKGYLYGKLAVPTTALNDRKIRRALDQVYQSLAMTNLLEPNIEIWAINPKRH